MNNPIRVRFAPSPTGPLHIGGVPPRAYWGTSKDKYIFTTLILNKIVKNPIYKLRDGVNLIFNKKILTQFKIKDDYYGNLGWAYGNINKTQLDQFKLGPSPSNS